MGHLGAQLLLWIVCIYHIHICMHHIYYIYVPMHMHESVCDKVGGGSGVAHLMWGHLGAQLLLWIVHGPCRPMPMAWAIARE